MLLWKICFRKTIASAFFCTKNKALSVYFFIDTIRQLAWKLNGDEWNYKIISLAFCQNSKNFSHLRLGKLENFDNPQVKLFPNSTSISFNYLLISWVSFSAKRCHTIFLIHRHMKYFELTLKLVAKNKEKFVTHDIFEVIPSVQKPFCNFLDSQLKSYDFVGRPFPIALSTFWALFWVWSTLKHGANL